MLMHSPLFIIDYCGRHARKVALLFICLAVLLVSGCTKKLEVMSAEGPWADAYDDGRLHLSLEYIEDELLLVVRNLTYEPMSLSWPEDSLELPNGSKLTLGYLKKKALNQEATNELISEYLKQSGKDSIKMRTLPNESSSSAVFVDFSPRTIKMLETVYYRIVAVKDQDDFAAPMKYPFGKEEKLMLMGPEILSMKKGQYIGWRFSYKLLQSNEVYNTELKVRIAG